MNTIKSEITSIEDCKNSISTVWDKFRKTGDPEDELQLYKSIADGYYYMIRFHLDEIHYFNGFVSVFSKSYC